MTVMTAGRPPLGPSPWPGSQHEDQHRWHLDRVRDLAEAAAALRDVAAELRAAHRAGWWLVAPMRDGHLVAARASRRTRGDAAPPEPGSDVVAPPDLPAWRLRVVDEPPAAGEGVLRLGVPETAGTPVLRRDGDAWTQVGGPELPAEVVVALTARLAAVDLGDRSWAVVPARVGPLLDLVSDGSGLRVHAVRDGVLVRTVEVLTARHAADRAASLPAAAAAYDRVADVADAMAAAGGRLSGADDGLLVVAYER